MDSEKISLKMKKINEVVSGLDVQSPESVAFLGGTEIKMDLSCGMRPVWAKSAGQEFAMMALRQFDFSWGVGYPADPCPTRRESAIIHLKMEWSCRTNCLLSMRCSNG